MLCVCDPRCQGVAREEIQAGQETRSSEGPQTFASPRSGRRTSPRWSVDSQALRLPSLELRKGDDGVSPSYDAPMPGQDTTRWPCTPRVAVRVVASYERVPRYQALARGALLPPPCNCRSAGVDPARCHAVASSPARRISRPAQDASVSRNSERLARVEQSERVEETRLPARRNRCGPRRSEDTCSAGTASACPVGELDRRTGDEGGIAKCKKYAKMNRS